MLTEGGAGAGAFASGRSEPRRQQAATESLPKPIVLVRQQLRDQILGKGHRNMSGRGSERKQGKIARKLETCDSVESGSSAASQGPNTQLTRGTVQAVLVPNNRTPLGFRADPHLR